MGALGLVATFLPRDILAYMGGTPHELTVLAIQVTGALYLGFAFLNWMAQGHLIGGIYSRPVAVGNFGHFTVAALALLKGVMSGQHDLPVVIAAAVYAAFAIAFALVLFRHPIPNGAGKREDP